MILAFDTETTGLPDFRAPSDAPHQPHLVQLAMILLDDDLVEQASVNLIIRPEGWEIPKQASDIHGITTEKALALGVPEKMATDLYVSMALGSRPICDGPRKVLAHNADFDLRLMRIAMLRNGYDKDWQAAREPQAFCTMKAATPIVNLPPTPKMLAAGFNKPKSASLTECVRHFFNEELDGAHDALVDVRACVRVYRHLQTAQVRVADVGDVI